MLSGFAMKSGLVVLATAMALLGQAANEKAAKSADGKPPVVPITQEEHHHLVLENDYVRVFHVVVPPHSETKFHQHDMDYVFVTLGDSVVESERVGEQPVKLELKDGDTRFTKGGFAHKAVNLSDKPFVNVTVELKKGYVPPPVAPGVFVKGDGRTEIVPGRNQTPEKSLLVAESPMQLVEVRFKIDLVRRLKTGEVVWVSFPNHYVVRKLNGADVKFTLLTFSDGPRKLEGAF